MARLIVPILAYHAIHPDRLDTLSVTPANFAAQMGWLAKHGYKGVNLATYVQHGGQDAEATRKMVAITFDDGYLDNLTYAWPILEKLGFSATIFVITERVATQMIHHAQWLVQYPTVPPPAYQYVSWADVRTLHSKGIEIGSHTCTHPMLEQLGFEAQSYEIGESKRIIEHHLGQPVKSFCYPAGHYNKNSLKIVEAAGYEQAVVTPWRAGLNYSGRFTLKRVGIYQHDTFLRYRFKVSPLFGIARTLRDRLPRRVHKG